MKLPEIKRLIKENKIKVSSIKNKQELINILIEHKVLPSDYVDKPQKENDEKANNEKRKGPHNCPSPVEVLDIRSGEVSTFKSLYACGRALELHSGLIKYHNGRIIKNRYLIKVCDKLKSGIV